MCELLATEVPTLSYFEQEKLIALDEEEQSRWDNETVSARRSKIEDKGKDEPAEPGSKESWQKLAGRTIAHFRITFSLFLKASLGAHPFI